MKTLTVCSGGLDSVSLAYSLHSQGHLSRLVTFDYGQRHKKEITFAAECAKDLNVPHHIIDMRSIGAALTGSALTDDINVPDGHYAEDTMKITVVPNRNAIMLAIAYGVAAANGDDAVAAAVHGGDHFIYPDCRPDFIAAFAAMQNHALDGYADIQMVTPFVHQNKADIVREGARVGTPFEKTWSCYKGGSLHCGRCGTCVERQEAFDLAGVNDPTPYADRKYWRETLSKKEVADVPHL